jgi:hypothetical protein
MEPSEVVGAVYGFLILAMVVMLYFFPSFVAHRRNHNNYTPIVLVNFLFGWTFIGWIVALIWACTDNVKSEINQCAR